MAGKPKIPTDKIVTALESTNGLVSLAARKLGCSPQAIYYRSKGTHSIAETIQNSREELVDQAELALRAAVLDREPWAIALVLKTLGRNRGYSEKPDPTGGERELKITVHYSDGAERADSER